MQENDKALAGANAVSEVQPRSQTPNPRSTTSDGTEQPGERDADPYSRLAASAHPSPPQTVDGRPISSSLSTPDSIDAPPGNVRKCYRQSRTYWNPCYSVLRSMFIILEFVVIYWELHEMRSELRQHHGQLQARSTDAKTLRAEVLASAASIPPTLCAFYLINHYLRLRVLGICKTVWRGFSLPESLVNEASSAKHPWNSLEPRAPTWTQHEEREGGTPPKPPRAHEGSANLPKIRKRQRPADVVGPQPLGVLSGGGWRCKKFGFTNSRSIDAACVLCGTFLSVGMGLVDVLCYEGRRGRPDMTSLAICPQ